MERALASLETVRKEYEQGEVRLARTDEESARPSVLAALNEKSDKEEPVKPFRSHSDRDGDAR